MLMDAISCLIVLFSAIFYARKGFALTMISMFQGIACIVFGLLFCEDVGSFLKNKTGFGDYLTTSLTNAFSENVQESTFYKSIPDIFNNWVSDAANTTIRHTADAAASVITTIIGFLLIVLAVKLICFSLPGSSPEKTVGARLRWRTVWSAWDSESSWVFSIC